MAKEEELLSSAPWRGEDDQSEMFRAAKLKVTNQPGSSPTMHVPRKKTTKPSDDDEEDESALDPELRYSFQRNHKFVQWLFSIETIVKPLPPATAYNISPKPELLHPHLVRSSSVQIGAPINTPGTVISKNRTSWPDRRTVAAEEELLLIFSTGCS